MARRGLLLDRDGVINVDQGYVGTRHKFEFLPGLFDFLRAAQDKGYRLAVATNQSGVARGFYSVKDFQDLSQWMQSVLRTQGIAIDYIAGCFEHPDASVELYKRESYWRKPNPGLLLEIATQLRLDLTHSAFIGDKHSDMVAAKAACVGNCLWLTDKPDKNLPGVTAVANYIEALKTL